MGVAVGVAGDEAFDFQEKLDFFSFLLLTAKGFLGFIFGSSKSSSDSALLSKITDTSRSLNEDLNPRLFPSSLNLPVTDTFLFWVDGECDWLPGEKLMQSFVCLSALSPRTV